VKEFGRRGYKHHTPLDRSLAKGKRVQDVFLNTKKEQKIILEKKKCQCFKNKKTNR
jgi:hypothetical protein